MVDQLVAKSEVVEHKLRDLGNWMESLVFLPKVEEKMERLGLTWHDICIALCHCRKVSVHEAPGWCYHVIGPTSDRDEIVVIVVVYTSKLKVLNVWRMSDERV